MMPGWRSRTRLAVRLIGTLKGWSISSFFRLCVVVQPHDNSYRSDSRLGSRLDIDRKRTKHSGHQHPPSAHTLTNQNELRKVSETGRLTDHIGRYDCCKPALCSIGHRVSLAVVVKDWNSSVRGLVFAGILANRDRRLLALFTPNGHFAVTGSLTPKLPLTLVNRD